jgi:hypothetical protein
MRNLKPRSIKPLASGRIRCCIVGCGRTFKDTGEHGEVICGRHYRNVTMATKAWRRKIKRTWLRVDAKANREMEVFGGVKPSTLRAWEVCRSANARSWERVKQEAMGI